MPIALTKEKLIEVVQGEAKAVSGRFNFQGAEFDSREISGGELFVALPGAETHGHAFVEGAFKRGAALALVEDRKFLELPEFGERVVYVPNTLAAFSELARWWRRERKARHLPNS